MEGIEFTDQIHQIASGHLRGDTIYFEPIWKGFLAEFQQGTTQPPAQNISTLNVKLDFLRMLVKQFPVLDPLRTDPRVIDLILGRHRLP